MVVLQHGETRVAVVPGTFRGTPGVLTLTNRRLIFDRKTGLVKKRIQTLADLSLLSIEHGAVIRTSGKKILVLTVGTVGHTGPPRLEFEVDEPESLQREIASLADRLRAEKVEASRSRLGMPPIAITIHPPPTVIPPPQVMIRCPFCKTVYPELAARCPSCGAHF